MKPRSGARKSSVAPTTEALVAALYGTRLVKYIEIDTYDITSPTRAVGR